LFTQPILSVLYCLFHKSLHRRVTIIFIIILIVFFFIITFFSFIIGCIVIVFLETCCSRCELIILIGLLLLMLVGASTQEHQGRVILHNISLSKAHSHTGLRAFSDGRNCKNWVSWLIWGRHTFLFFIRVRLLKRKLGPRV